MIAAMASLTSGRCVTSDGAYTINLEPLFKVFRSGEKIILQMPGGLMQYSVELADCISKALDTEVVVQADTVYGACDLHIGRLAYTLGQGEDRYVIAHLGHTPYPPDLGRSPPPRGGHLAVSGLKIVFIDVLSNAKIDAAVIDSLAEMAAEGGFRSIAVLATAQHLHVIDELAARLSERGFEAVIPPGEPPYFRDGQVIGCDYRVARRAARADAYVIVAGGRFHSLGLYLATLKPVLQVDPYRGEVADVTKLGEATLKKRLLLVARAMEGRHMGLIVGLKEGQYRPWLVERIKMIAGERGVRYTIYLSDTLREEDLYNIDNPMVDYYVVTSCPRLAIDDLSSYPKPVLTPGEAFMALNRRLEPYRFPW